MVIQKIASSRLQKEYGILCQRLYSNKDLPFGSTYCVIEPKTSTSRHNHHEGETFLILKGSGTMTILSESESVTEGDVIFIPPFSHHTLENSSDTENLSFLSIYWEEPNRAWEFEKPKKVLVYSAPPTPNGDLHVGHLSGPYIAADICKRFLNLNNVHTSYVSGSDDHQSYVPVKGKKLGISSDEVIEKFDRSILATLNRANVKLDYFLKARSNAGYTDFVQTFFQKLVKTNKIVLRDTQIYFCNHCQLNLYEAHISGNCPYCNELTNGNGCEQCGVPNDCIDLKNPQCNHCKNTPSFKSVQKYYFPLNDYKESLKKLYDTASLPTEMRAFALRLIDQNLKDVSATHLADWGIPVPGQPNQVIYEWLEMAAGYLYIASEASGGTGYGTYWKNPENKVIQCFGWDNSFFYLAFVPALMLAFDAEIQLPSHFLINQFYLLDHKKFSTSRQHAVWGDEILETASADNLRLYLAANRPEGRQTNFSMADFSEFIEKEINTKWKMAFSIFNECAQQLNFETPEIKLERNAKQRAFSNKISNLLQDITNAYQPQAFSLNTVGRGLCQFIDTLVDFYHTEDKLSPVYSKVLYLSATKLFAEIAQPVMPDLSSALLNSFNCEATQWPHKFSELKAKSPFKEFKR